MSRKEALAMVFGFAAGWSLIALGAPPWASIIGAVVAHDIALL